MSIVMGIMIVFMVAGFMDFEHNHMMGGHDKSSHQENSAINNHDKEASHDFPAESNKKDEDINKR